MTEGDAPVWKNLGQARQMPQSTSGNRLSADQCECRVLSALSHICELGSSRAKFDALSLQKVCWQKKHLVFKAKPKFVSFFTEDEKAMLKVAATLSLDGVWTVEIEPDESTDDERRWDKIQDYEFTPDVDARGNSIGSMVAARELKTQCIDDMGWQRLRWLADSLPAGYEMQDLRGQSSRFAAVVQFPDTDFRGHPYEPSPVRECELFTNRASLTLSLPLPTKRVRDMTHAELQYTYAGPHDKADHVFDNAHFYEHKMHGWGHTVAESVCAALRRFLKLSDMPTVHEKKIKQAERLLSEIRPDR